MIKDEVRALVRGKNFATISTLLSSGQIQTHVVWVDCDDGLEIRGSRSPSETRRTRTSSRRSEVAWC